MEKIYLQQTHAFTLNRISLNRIAVNSESVCSMGKYLNLYKIFFK